MFRPHDAVPLALEIDPIMRPMRAFQARIGQAQQQVEQPKEGRVGSFSRRAPPRRGTTVFAIRQRRNRKNHIMLPPHGIARQESSAHRLIGEWRSKGDSIPVVCDSNIIGVAVRGKQAEP